MMLERVFLSYSLEDEAWVNTLRAELLKKLRPPRGSNLIYFAPMSNRHGTEWEQQLWDALEQSPVFLLVVSRFSASSAWVHQEVARALKRRSQDSRRIIIPLMLTSDTGCLSKIDPELEKLHFINFFPEKDQARHEVMLKTLVYDLKHLDDIRAGRPVDQRPPPQIGDALAVVWNALTKW